MRLTVAILTVLVVLSLLPLGALAAPGPDVAPAAGSDPDARFYVELTITDGAQAAALSKLIPDWAETLEAGATRVILTQAEIDRLLSLGYSLTVTGPAPDLPDAWPACYNRLSDLYSWLQTYAAAHPNFVELIDYGDSWCKQQGGCTTPGGQTIAGYDLWVARLTNESAAGPKAGRLFVDGGIHAREIPTPELAKAFIELLVGGYGVDPDITWLLDQREVYVVLSSNPDGRHLVELGTTYPPSYNPWYWRKNGDNSIAGSNACGWPPSSGSQYGVDLNRNHIFKWDASGHSTYVCDQDYRGPTPGSEPEIQAYENFVRSIIPDQRGPNDNDPAPATTTGFLINLHNVAGVILVPWGWTTNPAPNDAQLEAIAAKMGTYSGYPYQNALYPVSGNTRDWAYGELGIPAYVIELDGDDFFTTCSLLPGIINGMLPALKYAARISDLPYQRVFGPDARNVTTTPATINAGGSFNLTAQINDTQNGNQVIAAAEYYLVGRGAPPPGAPGSGTAMTPSDGTFNSTTENVQATVSTAGLGRGRYLALVRGKDVGNNWGPFFAQQVQVNCFFADMNCNGQVDVSDISATALGVQQFWTNGYYNYVYDVNNNGVGDGDLDIIDVQLVAARFGPID